MCKKMLILRFEGALQSWDATSKWDVRATESFPTKSGIVGLLGCALGLKRGADELVKLCNEITVAVRADRAGEFITDYQTVTGSPLMNAEGKPKSTGNTIISHREYLQDACFTVFLQCDDFWHTKLTAALKSPKWCMYLGRKACVPSRPILECETSEYTDLNDAIINYPPAERAVYPMPYETELKDDGLSSMTRPDQLVNTKRGFVLRKIWRGSIREGSACI